MKQGDSRYERGKNCFKLAEKLAKDKGWTFGWQLVEAPRTADRRSPAVVPSA